MAVIKHEVLHVVLKHLLRAEGRHARLWNLACDVVVNGLIGQWQLPEGAITRATFPDLDLPDDATAETVYAALRSPAAADNAALRDLLAEEQTHMVGNHSDHSGWTGDNAPASQAAPSAGAGPAHPAAAEAMVDGLLTRAADRMAADGWGSVPGAVRDALEEARQRGRPTVDWRRALRLFSASAGRTRLVTTNRRESTRYGSTTLLGSPSAPGVTTAGRLAPGTKIKRRYALLVAIDTSGSIDDEQLEAFFTEIHAIWRTGAQYANFQPRCFANALIDSVFPSPCVPQMQIGTPGSPASCRRRLVVKMCSMVCVRRTASSRAPYWMSDMACRDKEG